MEHKSRAGALVAKPGALHIRILGSAPWPEKEGLDGTGLGLCVVLVIALWLDQSLRGHRGVPPLPLSEDTGKLCFSILHSTTPYRVRGPPLLAKLPRGAGQAVKQAGRRPAPCRRTAPGESGSCPTAGSQQRKPSQANHRLPYLSLHDQAPMGMPG